MKDQLLFHPENYTVETLEWEGEVLRYRAYRDIPYVTNPVYPNHQKLHLFAPEVYFEGEQIHGYDLHRAPIFIPNSCGAYAAAICEEPGRSIRAFNRDQINAVALALKEGLVVCTPALRGRGLYTENGDFVGGAPAHIVDYKAAVRWLRHNKDRIPGDTEKIISNGTSAGGALSALLGSTGNCAEYEPYLKEIGAADERDDIFAASCFCPITNLEHADMAYEWLLQGYDEFHSVRFLRDPETGLVTGTPFEGQLTEEQKQASLELKENFIEYLNGLNLKTPAGEELQLDEQGEGTFKEYLREWMKASAQRAVDQGADLSGASQIQLDGANVCSFDLDEHVRVNGRMKPAPSFDEWSGKSPENELFGSGQMHARHFTAFAQNHDDGEHELADPTIIRLMNPMNYIQNEGAETTNHWRIRVGSHDMHTSWAISLILATRLQMEGKDVDLHYQWDTQHSGDYEMDDLFRWIRRICP